MRSVGRYFLVFSTVGWAVSLSPAAVPNRPLAVVANRDTPALSEEALRKLYLGKIVEVDGKQIIPVNLSRGNALRREFMEQVLVHDDDKFTAYWTVRRYIGKGSPPREFATVQDQIEFLRSTPGAVGYVEGGTDAAPGLKTVLVKQ